MRTLPVSLRKSSVVAALIAAPLLVAGAWASLHGGEIRQNSTTTLHPVAADTTTLDRVYSMAQVELGWETFETICMRCHQLEDFAMGGIYSITDRFTNLGEMYSVIMERMPADDPGSLMPEEYAAVVAYVLYGSGYPAGEENLAAEIERLNSIRIVPPPAKTGD